MRSVMTIAGLVGSVINIAGQEPVVFQYSIAIWWRTSRLTMDEDLAVTGLEGVDRSGRSVLPQHERQIASQKVMAFGPQLT